MPVILLTPNLEGWDGVSRLARAFARTLEADLVISLHDDPACTRFEASRVLAAGSGRARFLAAILQEAVRTGPDTIVVAVHLHVSPAGLAFVARGASLVTVLCGIESWARLTLIQRTATRRSRLLAISRHTAERFVVENPRASRSTIEVCHPGIEDWPPGEGVSVISVPAERPIALIVGRMSANERYKGHDTLLEIWHDVSSTIPGACLEIVGDGDDRPRLEAKAAALGLVKHVHFAGQVSDAELARRYDACTVFVMPSRDEGFGFAFLEAMRAGRACVGAHGAASEIIEDERTGLLVDSGNPRQVREAIVRLLRNRAATAAMGECGRARFVERFTEQRFRARLAALMPRDGQVLASP